MSKRFLLTAPMGVRSVVDVVMVTTLVCAVGVGGSALLKRVLDQRAAERARMPSSPLSLAGAHVLGVSTASVVMVEYSDFECPFCGKFSREAFPEIVRRYVDTGRVLFAFRQDPLHMHKFALPAAAAAECAGRQGRFWEFQHILFDNQAKLKANDLRLYATQAHTTLANFDNCLGSDSHNQVQADMKEAASLRIMGTPTFLLGMNAGQAGVLVRRRVDGFESTEALEAAVDEMLTVAAASASKGSTGRD